MTLNKLFALVDKARETGRPIQYQSGPGDAWETLDGDGDYCFSVDSRYRVKPAPREWWVMPGGVNPVVPLEMCNRTSAEMIAAGYVLTREVL